MNAANILRRNLVTRRAELRLSQAALADRARISRATLSKIEQGDGNITIAKLEKIAAVLGCRLDEMFAPRDSRLDGAEIHRRAAAANSEFVDARALEGAIEEAIAARYSNAGRRPAKMGRRIASRVR